MNYENLKELTSMHTLAVLTVMADAYHKLLRTLPERVQYKLKVERVNTPEGVLKEIVLRYVDIENDYTPVLMAVRAIDGLDRWQVWIDHDLAPYVNLEDNTLDLVLVRGSLDQLITR